MTPAKLEEKPKIAVLTDDKASGYIQPSNIHVDLPDINLPKNAVVQSVARKKKDGKLGYELDCGDTKLFIADEDISDSYSYAQVSVPQPQYTTVASSNISASPSPWLSSADVCVGNITVAPQTTSYSEPITSVSIVLNMGNIFEHPAVFSDHDEAMDYIKRHENEDENIKVIPRNTRNAYASFMVVNKRTGEKRKSNYIMFSESII